MSLVGRNPSRWRKNFLKAGCATQFAGDHRALRPGRFSRALQLFLVIAAVSALAACGQSSSSNSDSTAFTLPGITAAKPSVTLAAMKTSVAMGTSTTLQWSAKDAQSCTASGGWSGSQPTSGTVTTDPLMANTTYVLTCTGPGGQASQSAEVVVVSPAPTVTLAASPTTVASGGVSTLTWTSANATACTASGGWSGTVATSGTWSTGALASTSEFELTCTGEGGSATQSATVTVSALPPLITFGAAPSSVNSGAAATLTWSTQNATACSASGDWSGTKALNGSQSTGALTANATYSLTCTGSGGSATQSATVSVKVGRAECHPRRRAEHDCLRHELNAHLECRQRHLLFRLRRLVRL